MDLRNQKFNKNPPKLLPNVVYKIQYSTVSVNLVITQHDSLLNSSVTIIIQITDELHYKPIEIPIALLSEILQKTFGTANSRNLPRISFSRITWL